MNRRPFRRLRSTRNVMNIALLIAALASMEATAIDPTELQPASQLRVKGWEFQQEFELEHDDESEGSSETSVEYFFTNRLGLKLKVPIEFSSDDDDDHFHLFQHDDDDEDGIGDVEVRGRFIFNPESESGFVAGVTAAVILPTSDESDDVDLDLRLRLSQWRLGASEKHGVHATFKAYFENDDESDDEGFLFWRRSIFADWLGFERVEDERDVLFTGVLGYTFDATADTRFIVDTAYKQLEDENEEALLVEAGLVHKFSEKLSVAVGVGSSVSGDGPDFQGLLGFQLNF